MKYEYRITKYDPKYRNREGFYTRKEWTSFADVGRLVDINGYELVEDKYLDAAEYFLAGQGVIETKIAELQNPKDFVINEIDLENGAILSPIDTRRVMKEILRENVWAKIMSKNAFVHFGWDYYMYIGVSRNPTEAIRKTVALGLFVEEFKSPYKRTR